MVHIVDIVPNVDATILAVVRIFVAVFGGWLSSKREAVCVAGSIVQSGRDPTRFLPGFGSLLCGQFCLLVHRFLPHRVYRFAMQSRAVRTRRTQKRHEKHRVIVLCQWTGGDTRPAFSFGVSVESLPAFFFPPPSREKTTDRATNGEHHHGRCRAHAHLSLLCLCVCV